MSLMTFITERQATCLFQLQSQSKHCIQPSWEIHPINWTEQVKMFTPKNFTHQELSKKIRNADFENIYTLTPNDTGVWLAWCTGVTHRSKHLPAGMADLGKIMARWNDFRNTHTYQGNKLWRERQAEKYVDGFRKICRWFHNCIMRELLP